MPKYLSTIDANDIDSATLDIERALNFTETYYSTNPGFGPKTGTDLRAVGCTDADGAPFFCVLATTNRVWKTQTPGLTFTEGGDYSGSTETIYDLSGDQPGVLAALAIVAGDSRVYFSDDGGASWTDPADALPTSTYDYRIAYSSELQLWIATGSDVGTGFGSFATAPRYGITQEWTAHVVPWTQAASAPVRRVVVPRAGETGNGVAIVLGHASENRIFYTLDGETVLASASTGHTSLRDACWHEADKHWYAIASDGALLRTPALDEDWQEVKQLLTGGGQNYLQVRSWGRALLVTGSGVAGGPELRSGSLLAMVDPKNGPYYACLPLGGLHSAMFEFDGRLCTAYAPGGTTFYYGLGMRRPDVLI